MSTVEDSTDELVIQREEKKEKFRVDCEREVEKLRKYQKFFESMIDYDIELPYDAAYGRSSYCNIAQFHYNEEHKYVLDEAETVKAFARVARWARANSYDVEKEYKDDEFAMWIDSHDEVIGRFQFYSTRQAVCEKVVVGKKIVPAVPEKEVEEVEWVCKNIAFLGVEV